MEPRQLELDIVDITQNEKYKNLDESKDFREQLELKLIDLSNDWTLVENHIYYFNIELFDNEKDLIDLTDNLDFKTELSDEYFEILKVNKIKSQLIVRTKKATPNKEKTPVLSYLNEIKSQIDVTYQVNREKIS